MASRIAAIDVGSNSMRVAVVDVGTNGLLRVVEEERSTQRLISDVTRFGRLQDDTMTEAIAIIADFVAIANAAGADEIRPVATSAVRDAENSAEFVARVHDELGLDLQVIAGAEEARLTYLGAIHSLPVEHGMVLDIGGGSLELAQFRDRQLVETWVFPLGAVRLTDEFAMSDPPKRSEIDKLRKYVNRLLADTGVQALSPEDSLVGTGGSIRNLSKVSAAATDYPFPRLHGHVLTRDDLAAVRQLLCEHDLDSRGGISGLNSDRADSIVAGAITAEVIAEYLQASSLVVSGQGLREGIALSENQNASADLRAMREASIRNLQHTFAPSWTPNAARRTRLIEELCNALMPELAPDLRAALAAAGALIDLGRDIDYYRRGRQTESLLLAHGLPGYSQREIAATCAMVRQAEQVKFNIAFYTPLLTEDDREDIARASAILAAAEDIARRTVHSNPARWTVSIVKRSLTLSGPLSPGSRPAVARERLGSAFGVDLTIEEPVPAPAM